MHATGTRRRMKTEHFTGRSTHAYLSRCALCSTLIRTRFIQCVCTVLRLDELNQHVGPVLKNIAYAPQSFLHLMSCRNLLGLPDRRPTFPDGLEAELGITCSDPRGGGWFGRMVEQSPPRVSPLRDKFFFFARVTRHPLFAAGAALVTARSGCCGW